MNSINLPAKVREESNAIATAATEVRIRKRDDLEGAAELLTRIKAVGKAITAEKEKITKPLSEGLKAARAFFAPFEANVDEAEATVKEKIVVYNQFVAAQAERKREATMDKVAEGDLSYEQGLQKLNNIPTAQRSVTTDSGSIATKRVKKARVVDFGKLPDRYKVPDMATINQAMRTGIAIPGVEYYEEDVIAVRV